MVLIINTIKRELTKELKVPGKLTRRLMAYGSSLLMSIPMQFVRIHGLKKGQKMAVYYYKDVILIKPMLEDNVVSEYEDLLKNLENEG